MEGWEDFPCWVFYEDEALTKCDDTVGAGVIFPPGDSTSNVPCDLPKGQRYLDGDDPLFAERLGCISHIGIGGAQIICASSTERSSGRGSPCLPRDFVAPVLGLTRARCRAATR